MATAPERVSVPAGAGPLSRPYRTVTLGLLVLVSLVAFEALAVSTAMPVVAVDLGGVRSYGLAFSLFLTMTLLGTVLAGGWTDVRGPTGPLVTGLALFASGLAVSGFAGGFPAFLVGRVVAGTGGGFLTVALYVVVARAYPEALRPRVFGWISAAWVLPSVIGPALAGWLATQVTWRAVFLGVLPLAVVALLALRPQLTAGRAAEPAAQDGAPGRTDRRRRAALGTCLAVGAASLQWGGQEVGRDVRLVVVVSLVAGAALVASSLPALLPAGTLSLRHGLPSVIAVRGLFTASFFAAETFVPLMLVQERGVSPLVAGLTLTGGAIGWSIGSWLQGRPDPGLSRRGLMVLGGLLVGASIAVLPAAVLLEWPTAVVLPVWAVAGLGMGLGMTTTSVLLLDLSAEAEQGRNTAALQISDALGGVLGIGCAGAIFAALHDPAGSDADVFALIWGGLAVLGLLAAALGRRTVRRPGVAPAAVGPVRQDG